MDGVDGVGTHYSSFVPICCDAKSVYILMAYTHCLKLLQERVRMENLQFAHFLNCNSLNSYAAHKN